MVPFSVNLLPSGRGLSIGREVKPDVADGVPAGDFAAVDAFAGVGNTLIAELLPVVGQGCIKILAVAGTVYLSSCFDYRIVSFPQIAARLGTVPLTSVKFSHGVRDNLDIPLADQPTFLNSRYTPWDDNDIYFVTIKGIGADGGQFVRVGEICFLRGDAQERFLVAGV